MPQYVELVRRAVAAQKNAAEVATDSRRIGALAQVLRDAEAGRTLIRRCAWCDRLNIDGEWLHLDAVGSRQHRIAAAVREHTTHGICEDCLERTRRAAEAHRRGRPKPD